MKIGIYSGSFNPVHNGHIALANYLIKNRLVDEVWLIVSPQNPLKNNRELLDDNLRLQMAKIAFRYSRKIKVSDIEFSLPKPSYTIDTLNFLQKQYPENQFLLLTGGDNAAVFHKWKNYNEIIAKYNVMVYPRAGYDIDKTKFPQMKFIDAPLLNLSSTEIRNRIANNQNISDFMPEKVIDFIRENKLYSK